MDPRPVLIDGQWRAAQKTSTFQAHNPQTREPLADHYPVSAWSDCDQALDAAARAFDELQAMPGAAIAGFLEDFANRIESRADELVDMANQETALAKAPRLADVELPRTTNQLRLAAQAARDESWRQPIKDDAANIHSCRAGLGPVCVFGPNNFPFAFGSVSGGDFAAAIAAGNPVIGKANSCHPGTTRIFAEEALAALQASDLPDATVQLIYRTAHDVGANMVSDPRVGATGYTGSRQAGLALKAAADAAGKPIYLELSSINPVVILSGALQERSDAIAEDFAASCLMGTGQFCTNPGCVIVPNDESGNAFVAAVAERFTAAPAGTLLSGGVEDSMRAAVDQLVAAGAEEVTDPSAAAGAGFSCRNTLLKVAGSAFLNDSELFQTEVFGNASLFVMADHTEQLKAILESLEGNLTGCIYSDTSGSDDSTYQAIEPALRRRVGRLLNDKMPTGVAVSAAMNHGGPYPATGHPGFTAVGMPTAISRFTTLQCYDNVRPERLPSCLR